MQISLLTKPSTASKQITIKTRTASPENQLGREIHLALIVENMKACADLGRSVPLLF